MKSTSELKREGNLNPEPTQIPNSVKTILWLVIDLFLLMCLYYLIYTITGVPEFDIDATPGRVGAVSISLLFWLILIIKFSIRKDLGEAIRRQRIFALSSLIAILSVFILNGFQELIGEYLFPEWYDLIPCSVEELEVAGVYFSRYIILSIFLLITTAVLSFSISYLCISRRGKNRKQELMCSKVENEVEQSSQGESGVSYSNHPGEFGYKSATKVKLFFLQKNLSTNNDNSK